MLIVKWVWKRNATHKPRQERFFSLLIRPGTSAALTCVAAAYAVACLGLNGHGQLRARQGGLPDPAEARAPCISLRL